MEQVRRKLATLQLNPLKAIEWVMLIGTALSGIYILSPLYAIGVREVGVSAFAAALSYPITIAFFGAVLLAGCALILYGLVRSAPRIKAMGWFIVGLARLFQVITVIAAVGILPFVTWIHPFTLMCVMFILWAAAKGES